MRNAIGCLFAHSRFLLYLLSIFDVTPTLCTNTGLVAVEFHQAVDDDAARSSGYSRCMFASTEWWPFTAGATVVAGGLPGSNGLSISTVLQI